MLQSVPRSQKAYGPQAVSRETAAVLTQKVAKIPSNLRIKKTVTSLPLRRRRLVTLLVRKCIFQLMNDKKLRRQAIRCSLLVLPVFLLLTFAVTMVLGNWAEAQAAQSHQSGSLAAFQRQQMFHASVHVPQ